MIVIAPVDGDSHIAQRSAADVKTGAERPADELQIWRRNGAGKLEASQQRAAEELMIGRLGFDARGFGKPQVGSDRLGGVVDPVAGETGAERPAADVELIE